MGNSDRSPSIELESFASGTNLDVAEDGGDYVDLRVSQISSNTTQKNVSFSRSNLGKQLFNNRSSSSAVATGQVSISLDDSTRRTPRRAPLPRLDMSSKSPNAEIGSPATSVTSSGMFIRRTNGHPLKRWWLQVPLLYKMMIVSGIPMIGLLVFIGLRLSNESADMEASNKIFAYAGMANSMVQLLADTQVERALTHLMMENPSADNIANLRAHRATTTDVHRAEFLKYIKEGGIDSLPQIRDSPQLETVTTYLLGLDQHRSLVDQLKITTADSNKYFTRLNGMTVAVMWIGQSLVTQPELKNYLLLMNLNMNFGESLGIERLLGSSVIVNGGHRSEAELLAYNDRVSISKFLATRHVVLYSAVSAAQPLDFLEKTDERRAEIGRLQAQLTVYRSVLAVNNTAAIAGLDWQVYFANMTSIIDEHKSDGLRLLNVTVETARDNKSDANNNVVLLVFVLVLFVVVTVLLGWVLITSIQFTNSILKAEVHHRKRTQNAIWRFFPQEFMTILNKTDILNVRQGDRRQLEMCVMFSDIRDFTSISELLGPAQTYDWLMEYIQTVGPIIKAHNGFVDKTLGDGIMALFTCSQDALNCALDMQVEVGKLNLDNSRSELPPYNVGIGLHTGSVMLGVIGDDHRLEGTIVSDTVNTASRVEGLCKFYNSRIIISGATRDDCDMSGIGHRCLGSVRVVGKSESLEVYDVFQTDPDPIFSFKRDTKDDFEAASRAYQTGDFAACEEHMQRINAGVPVIKDGGIDRKLSMCVRMRDSGCPDDWNGEDFVSGK